MKARPTRFAVLASAVGCVALIITIRLAGPLSAGPPADRSPDAAPTATHPAEEDPYRLRMSWDLREEPSRADANPEFPGNSVTFPDDPLVIFGPDGVTPIYIEDPVDGSGVPLPIGPQHQRMYFQAREMPPGPPAPRASLREAALTACWAEEEVDRKLRQGLPPMPPDMMGPYEAEMEEYRRLAIFRGTAADGVE